MVSASGTKTGELRYDAWGKNRYTSGTVSTTFRYTGQREESDIKLYYYGARWYDPALGRFAQADTIVPLESQGVQAWDRYAGMNNNPVKYTDPTGHVVDEGDIGGDSNGKNNSEKPLCQIAPGLCQGGRWNPLNYDTMGVAAKINLKILGGIEVTPTIFFDPDALLYLDLSKSDDVGLFLDFDVSVGISEVTAVGLSVIGADGGVPDQLGISGPNFNAVGCAWGGCLGVGGTASDISRLGFSSVNYFLGAGQGFDVSGGVSGTDFGFYANKDVFALKVPLSGNPTVYPWP